jgi:hypothetical protein
LGRKIEPKATDATEQNHKFAAPTIVLVCVVAWLGLNWPQQSLWYDEALSVWVASGPWERLFNWCTKIDIQVPLHYIVMRGWMALAGNNEFSLHLLSAFCGLLAVAGMIALTKRLLGNRGAILAAILLGFTPGFLWIGYEVRAYALALALFAWSSAILVALLQPRKHYRWLMAVYCILTLAMFYTHYTGIAALASHVAIVAWVVWKDRRAAIPALRRMIVCWVVDGVGVAPWLPIFLSRGASDRSYYPGAILPDQTLGVIFSFKWLARDDFKWLTPEHAISPLAPFVAIGVILLIGGTILWIVRRHNWRPVIDGLAMALLPTLMIAVVVYFRPKLAGRYAWPAWLGIDLLLTCGLLALRSPAPMPARRRSRPAKPQERSITVALVGALILVAVPWLTGQTGHPPNSNFRGAFAFIRQNWRDDDMVVLRDGTLFPAAEYYESPTPYIGLPESLITDATHVLHADEAIKALSKVDNSARGVWLVTWQGDVMDPENISTAMLEMVGTRQFDEQSFGDVTVNYFALSKPLSSVQAPKPTDKPLVSTPDGLTLNSLILATAGPLHPGDSLVVHSWWVRSGPGDETRVSIRLVGTDGQPSGQKDQPPAGWIYYPDHWPENTLILGRYEMTIPLDAPAKISMKLVVYSAANKMKPVELVVGPVEIVAR